MFPKGYLTQLFAIEIRLNAKLRAVAFIFVIFNNTTICAVVRHSIFFAMRNQSRPTPEQALQKIKHYCAYQERCHAETIDKLYSMGLFKKEVDAILCTLIEENFLNEARFASEFASGKFRNKRWGKIKIKHALKAKKVSNYLIAEALAGIDEVAYLHTLTQLAEKKWVLLQSQHQSANTLVQQVAITQYLLQKGYELSLIQPIVRQLPLLP